MTSPFQWQLFIGPAWLPSDDAYHTDWSAINAGASFTVDYSTTLASALSSSGTSAVLTDASAFANSGGVWVGPNGSGQAWEYVGYSGKSSNTLTGLSREPSADREHNGTHSSGATVRRWYKVAQTDGRLRMHRMSDHRLVATEWQIEVSGIAAPQVALRPLHLAVVQFRTGVSGTWLTWAVGFLDRSTVRDDYQRQRAWTARIMSVAGLMRRLEATGVRMGDFDAVTHGSAQSSTVLAAAYKERDSGDYVAAAPSFDADNVLDDNDTIWIADEMVGVPEPVGSYEGWSQLYMYPPTSINNGYRWVEYVNRNTSGSDLIVWRNSDNTEWPLSDVGVDASADGRVVIAQDVAKFQGANPSARPTEIIDVNITDDIYWLDHFDPAGGAIAFKSAGTYSGVVRWGDNSNAPGWVTNSANGWTGAALDAPAAGQTLRYNPLAGTVINTKDAWQAGKNQSPGYQIKDDGDDVWLYLELPGMGLNLHEDITSSTPGNGATLLIDGQGGPSTDGLPSSGTLVIGDEHITYSAKSATGVTVSARGANSTTAAAHSAGDAVFLRHTQGGRTAVTDALPVVSTSWERYGGTIFPKNFTWRWSMLPARTPQESRHEDDYESYNGVTNHATDSNTQTHSPSLRIRSVLIEFQRMTTNPARPRLNRVTALVDSSYYDGDHWLNGGETIEQLMAQVAENVGIPSGALSVTGGGQAPVGFVTAIDSAWNVITSAAELGGSRVTVGLDSKLTFAPDTFWSTSVGSYAPGYTWDEDNAAAAELIRTAGGAVRQVRIPWQTPDGSDGGTAQYPTSWTTSLGRIDEQEMLYFANAAAAELAARKRYFISRYPHEMMVQLAAGNLNVAPLQVHALQWTFDSQMPATDRLLLVTQVEQVVENQVLNTVIYGVQIDRESEG